MTGRVLQRLISVHAILRRLHRDVVANAVFRIQPESRRGLEAGAERDEQVLGYVLGLQAQGLNACAVDIHMQRRLVEGLLHMDVRGTGNVAQLIRLISRAIA